MWKMSTVTTVSLLMFAPAVAAQAEPEDFYPDANYPDANYSVFLQAIGMDGIEMDDRQAIAEGRAICEFIRPPDDASLWEAGRELVSRHADWGMGTALRFATRSVQHICPHRGSF